VSRIGVVVPLFNHEPYITRAIESLLGQTTLPDEILVIDDGSTDRSADAVRRITAPSLEFVQQANAGAHVTINRGIERLAQRCDFIGVLNSDDEWEPERIARCVETLHHRPEIAVVCTDLIMIDESGSAIGSDDPRFRWKERVWHARRTELPAWLGIANFAKTTSNLLGRAAWFSAHPFRAYRYVHDYFFVLEAAMHDTLLVLHEPLLRYRVHTTNTIKSGEPGAVSREAVQMILDLLRSLAPALETSPQVRQHCAALMRELVKNHADFRVEPFLVAIAHALDAAPEAATFPNMLELETGSEKQALRDEEQRAKDIAEFSRLSRSSWVRLGRKLGLI
jgi:glycosyltransferase involved in cell wall biosynthesis